MIHLAISNLINEAVLLLVKRGELPEKDYPVPEVDPPKSSEHGDFASNFALVANKVAQTSPRVLAEKISTVLAQIDSTILERIEIAGPGFLNLTMKPEWAADTLRHVSPDPTVFVRQKAASPLKINMEFVSVNPNGPITIGSGRGAAYGSTLANVLEAAGHTIFREYYINDGVNSEQMRQFSESVRSIILGKAVPEGGYKGDYVHDVAAEMKLMFEAGTAPQDEIDFGADGLATRRHEAGLRLAKLVEIEGTMSAVVNCDVGDLQVLCEGLMTKKQAADLKTFGVSFDCWFSEQSLHADGLVNRDLHLLEGSAISDDRPFRIKCKMARGGKIEEAVLESQADLVDEDDVATGREATVWLRSTKFGDDMDRVLRRRDGRPTYIASDLSYHKNKFTRPPDADKLITVVGPDHHGYIGRLRAVIAAMLLSEGVVSVVDNPEPLTDIESKIFTSVQERNRCQSAGILAKQKLDVPMFQIVRFLKDGKPAPMRKRDGNVYALIDLINEIGAEVCPDGTSQERQAAGRDVARFFYLMRHHDTAFDFDLELATKQSDENPVFYVQYAHARICSVLAKGEEVGLRPSETSLHLLTHAKEKALVLKIWELPREIEASAADYGVNRFATYAIELSRLYHGFYDQCRVILPEDPELSGARLRLCEACRTALAATFGILGISAPVRMDRAPKPETTLEA